MASPFEMFPLEILAYIADFLTVEATLRLARTSRFNARTILRYARWEALPPAHGKPFDHLPCTRLFQDLFLTNANVRRWMYHRVTQIAARNSTQSNLEKWSFSIDYNQDSTDIGASPDSAIFLYVGKKARKDYRTPSTECLRHFLMQQIQANMLWMTRIAYVYVSAVKPSYRPPVCRHMDTLAKCPHCGTHFDGNGLYFSASEVDREFRSTVVHVGVDEQPADDWRSLHATPCPRVVRTALQWPAAFMWMPGCSHIPPIPGLASCCSVSCVENHLVRRLPAFVRERRSFVLGMSRKILRQLRSDGTHVYNIPLRSVRVYCSYDCWIQNRVAPEFYDSLSLDE